ncbi:hypothetical protein GCM10009600_12930 [Oerskovia paurometabola]
MEWDPRMGEYLRGVYEHDVRTITINSGMSRNQTRYAVAHELGHAWYGHRWLGDPHGDALAERLADQHAAQLLIDRHEYARAELLVGPHPGAIATELDLDVCVVAAWQSMLRTKRLTPIGASFRTARRPARRRATG